MERFLSIRISGPYGRRSAPPVTGPRLYPAEVYQVAWAQLGWTGDQHGDGSMFLKTRILLLLVHIFYFLGMDIMITHNAQYIHIVYYI